MLITSCSRAQEADGGAWHSGALTMQPFKVWSVRSLLIRGSREAEKHPDTVQAHRQPVSLHLPPSLSLSPLNTYAPIIERGRGLGPVLPATLLSDRLMRRCITPADQITPSWPSLPGPGGDLTVLACAVCSTLTYQLIPGCYFSPVNK